MTSQMRYFAEQVILAEIMHSHYRTFFLYTHRFIFYACINQFFMYKSDNVDFSSLFCKGGDAQLIEQPKQCNPYGAPFQTLRSKIGSGIQPNWLNRSLQDLAHKSFVDVILEENY